MDLSRTHFIKGAHHLGQCLPDQGLEVAFAGRSNAGKSSALNAVTGVNTLARISKQPGRTQQINFFEVAPGFHLVDLPGYGFAKVPPKLRAHWDAVLSEYFETRQALAGLVVIMDVRHPLKDLDQQMIDWVSQLGIPVHCLLSKADKLGKGAASAALQQVRKRLAGHNGLVTAQLFSARTRLGVDLARQKVLDWFHERDDVMAPVVGGGEAT